MNTELIEILESLKRLRASQGETGKAYGYALAIQAIQAYPHPIISDQEAVRIPGVNPSISREIDQFLSTGSLPDLDEATEKDRVIQLFMSVEKVGPVKAEKWYQAGYRTLEEIPASAATNAQRIGLRLHSELTQKIPRAEISQYQELLHQYFDPLQIQFQICGSYRRGKAESGDMDVLVIDQDSPDKQTMKRILEWPYLTDVLAGGSKKVLGVCRLPGPHLHRRIDFELVQSWEYPFALIYFTGPASFIVEMRDYCRSRGYRLNEKSLFDPEGQAILVDSEEELFQILGLQYLTPEERDSY